jgi:hypothetical protein
MATNEMQNGCESSIEAVLTSNQKRRRALRLSANWLSQFAAERFLAGAKKAATPAAR